MRKNKANIFDFVITSIIIVAICAGVIGMATHIMRDKSIEVVDRVEYVEVPVEIPVEAERPEPYGIVEAVEIPNIKKFDVPSDFHAIDCELDVELQEFTYMIGQAYNVDFKFLMGLMAVESKFDCNAISSTNDYGLMQINKCNHKWLSETLGITDFLDPYQNIIAGTYIIAGLFEKYDGDYHKVLMAYNMGDGGAKKLWKQGIKESNYSRMVCTKIAEMGEMDEC